MFTIIVRKGQVMQTPQTLSPLSVAMDSSNFLIKIKTIDTHKAGEGYKKRAACFLVAVSSEDQEIFQRIARRIATKEN